MAEISPLRRRMIEDMTVRNLSFLLISVYRRSSQGMDERTGFGGKQIRAVGKYERSFNH